MIADLNVTIMCVYFKYNAGKEILWSYLVTLYHRDAGVQCEAAGLALVPKIKYEHIHLT